MNPVIPAYYQIRNTIKDWIANKEYGSGDKIPSENALAKLFNVNRLTVRQGISLLVQEGLIKTKRGEGSFVTDNEDLIKSLGIDFTGFMDSLFYEVSRSTTKSAIIEKIPCPESLKRKLELVDDELVRIKRVRLLSEKIFAYTINYLPLSIGLLIKEKDLLNKSLLQIIEQDIGIEFEEAFQTIEASFSDIETSEQLEVPTGSPILFVERVMYDTNKRPIELVQTSYRGDNYKYIVKLSKDKSKKGNRWIQHAT